MWNLRDAQLADFKKETRVKQYYRKGRLVRAYTSLRDKAKEHKQLLLGLAGGATAAAGLGGAYLLGRKSVKVPPQVKLNINEVAAKVAEKLPQPQKLDLDELAAKVAAKLPKPEAPVVSAPTVDTDEIVRKVVSAMPKQTSAAVANSDDIVAAVERRIAASNKALLDQVDNRLSSISAGGSGAIVSGVKEIGVSKVKLPKSVKSISPKFATSLESLSDKQLQRKIQANNNAIKRYEKAGEEAFNARQLEQSYDGDQGLKKRYQDLLNLEAKASNPNKYVDPKDLNEARRILNEQKQQVNQLRSYFGLKKVNLEELDTPDFVIKDDPEYRAQLNKVLSVKKELNSLYQKELEYRANPELRKQVKQSVANRLRLTRANQASKLTKATSPLSERALERQLRNLSKMPQEKLNKAIIDVAKRRSDLEQLYENTSLPDDQSKRLKQIIDKYKGIEARITAEKNQRESEALLSRIKSFAGLGDDDFSHMGDYTSFVSKSPLLADFGRRKGSKNRYKRAFRQGAILGAVGGAVGHPLGLAIQRGYKRISKQTTAPIRWSKLPRRLVGGMALGAVASGIATGVGNVAREKYKTTKWGKKTLNG